MADKLFATLETKTRQWNVDGAQDVLLSDTVGFVRDLPHHLVASFRATLEEAIHADLLIHVADASNELVDLEIQAVDAVLDELGCDRSRETARAEQGRPYQRPDRADGSFGGSTTRRCSSRPPRAQGADELTEAVRLRSTGRPVRVELHANYRNGRLMQYIAQHGLVERESYDESVADHPGRLQRPATGATGTVSATTCASSARSR